MTTAEIIQYYADLLILQYKDKPKAYDTIKNVVTPFIMDKVALDVRDAFNVDTAVGDQLDILGKYVGCQRINKTFTTTVTLDDDDFRVLIKMKIIQNNSGSSLSDIQDLIFTYFPNILLVFDYQNMQMNYYFLTSAGSLDLAQVFVKTGALPKPMGVQLGALMYLPSMDNIFGFRTYDIAPGTISGFNTYSVYNEDWPWISYADAVVA